MESEVLTVINPDLSLFVLLVLCPWLMASLFLGLGVALESPHSWPHKILTVVLAPVMTLLFLVMIILPAIREGQKLEQIFDYIGEHE